MKEIKLRECKHHGVTEYVNESTDKNKKRFRCKKCRSDNVKKRREKIKQKAIEYKGGKCFKCGYNKCPDALEFHHKNPNEKEFVLTKAYTASWERVKKELDKCDLLCANCHREEHFKLNTQQQ